nr:immunoglobulin light chain junction region [Macaca mulatta]
DYYCAALDDSLRGPVF